MENLFKFCFKKSFYLSNCRLLQLRCTAYSAENSAVPKTSHMYAKEKEREANKAIKAELMKLGNALQWDEFRKKLVNREIRTFGMYITENNVDSVILKLCKNFKLFDIGQSYFQKINQEQPQLSSGILLQYLNLCTLNRQYSIENEEILINIYKKVTASGVVEPMVAERCIATVCLFENYWKEAFSLLEQVNQLSEPTPSSYSAVVEACFKFGDIDKGWQLLRQMAKTAHVKPKPECFIAYIDYCLCNASSNSDVVALLEDLFSYLEEYQLQLPDVTIVEKLEKFIFSLSDDKFVWSLKETYLPKTGNCSSCRRLLEPAQITSEEFTDLCRHFATEVMIGNNIFLKSTPEEIYRFKGFIKKAQDCDIVIDGLNSAYATGSKNPHIQSKTLKAVVDHFLRKNMKVVILGRAHMKTWPDMRYFYQTCNVFLATNLSQDDPLLLYAALRGGEKTCFISRDLMRSHTFLLSDARMKRLFRKWLVSHQYSLGYFDNMGRPSILPPLPYQPTAQKLPLTTNEICWHIPYYDEYQDLPSDKRVPSPKWLCIRRVPRQT